MKKLLQKALRSAGLDVRRIHDDRRQYVEAFGEGVTRERRFYNVGAGAFRHPCWTNIDHATDWYAVDQGDFLEHDLLGNEPLPIPDGAAQIIYSSHTIEHVPDAAVARLLRDCHRALKPGGVIRITTGPDADLDLAALLRGDVDWFYWDPSDRPIEHKWLYGVASALAPQSDAQGPKLSIDDVRRGVGEPDFLDRITSMVSYDPVRPGHHVSWWNEEKLIRFMNAAGFDAYRSGYGQSVCPVLRNTHHFDSTHPQFSLYVEAVR